MKEERMPVMDELIAPYDLVVRRATGGYEIVKNRFGEMGYLSEIALITLRKAHPTARVMVL
jgi:hypothetical protein